jgi:hypothetical protein
VDALRALKPARPNFAPARADERGAMEGRMRIWAGIGLTAGLLAIGLMVGARAEAAPSPRLLEPRIQSEGAKAVVAELVADWAGWQAVLAGVRSGRADWVRLAGDLMPGAGDLSQPLQTALSQALITGPQNVLGLLGGEVAASDVCFDHDPEPTPAEHAAFVARACEALVQVRDVRLASRRDACLASLRAHP